MTDRVSRIRHYREQMLNSAALIAAIASARFEDHSLLRDLASRHDDQLTDLLHDLAFKTRKLVELAEAQGFSVQDSWTRNAIPGQRVDALPPTGETEDFPAMYSLSHVLNRLIHSRDFTVERADVQIDGEHHEIRHELPWGFSVRSDHDGEGTQHFIWIDFLLDQVIDLDRRLEPFLKLHERSVGAQGTT